MPDMVECRNETPLDITLKGRKTFKPLEVAECDCHGSKELSFAAAQFDSAVKVPRVPSKPLVVTMDLPFLLRAITPDGETRIQRFLKELPSLKTTGQNELRVVNETSYVACVWLLDATGGRMMGQIPPGQTWEHPTQPYMMWHFRTRAGDPLGMWVHPNPYAVPETKPPFAVTLTTAYLTGWRALRQRPPTSAERTKRIAGPLRLIGERRKSTPGPDAQEFISVSTVRVDISRERFNGLENREVRDVEIAGALLHWSRRTGFCRAITARTRPPTSGR